MGEKERGQKEREEGWKFKWIVHGEEKEWREDETVSSILYWMETREVSKEEMEDQERELKWFEENIEK